MDERKKKKKTHRNAARPWVSGEVGEGTDCGAARGRGEQATRGSRHNHRGVELGRQRRKREEKKKKKKRNVAEEWEKQRSSVHGCDERNGPSKVILV